MLPHDIATVSDRRAINKIGQLGLRQNADGLFQKTLGKITIEVYAQDVHDSQPSSDDKAWGLRTVGERPEPLVSLSLQSLDTVLDRARYLKMTIQGEVPTRIKAFKARKVRK